MNSERTTKDDTCGLLSAFKSTTTTFKEDTNSNLQKTLQHNKGNNACSMCAQSAVATKHCNGQTESSVINNHCSEIRDVNSINNKGGLTYNTQLTF